jgi:nitrite reductase (NADH) large subunit
LRTQAGIVVDGEMRTSYADIFAIGDAAEPSSQVTGLWTLGAEHAERAVAAMFGRTPVLAATPHALHLKIPGIDVRAFGQVEASGPHQVEHVDPEAADNEHRKLVVENGRLVGAVFAGPPGSARMFGAILADPSASIPFGGAPSAGGETTNLDSSLP